LLAGVVGAVAFSRTAQDGQVETTGQRDSTTSSPLFARSHPIEEAPGYLRTLDAEQVAALRGATVKIGFRYPDAEHPQPWTDNCSGLKIDVDGRSYVLTARHCLEMELDTWSLFPLFEFRDFYADRPDVLEQMPLYLHARNVIRQTDTEFGIASLDANGFPDHTRPTAPVNAISLRYYPDVALLGIDESSPAAAAFDALPAIPYAAGLGPHPVPGSPVRMFGMPEASGNRQVAGSGVFLGEDQIPTDGRRGYYVGIKAASPASDACNYGASGSVALIAGGTFTGPLSGRSNGDNPAGSNGNDDPAVMGAERDAISRMLGRDLAQFPTICEYTALDRHVLADLVAGFDRPAQALTAAEHARYDARARRDGLR
jgi:hypothetical protein